MPGTVVGVASEKDVLVLEADVDAADLCAALDELHVAGKQLHVASDPAHVTLVVSRENLHNEASVQSAFEARFGKRVTLISGLGAVSVIGAGINASYANARAGLRSLADAGVTPRGMSTSSFRSPGCCPAITSRQPSVRCTPASSKAPRRSSIDHHKVATWNVNGIRARQTELQEFVEASSQRSLPAGNQGVHRSDSHCGCASSRATGATRHGGKAIPASRCTCARRHSPRRRTFTIRSSTTSIAS
jgi:hypothetical protein